MGSVSPYFSWIRVGSLNRQHLQMGILVLRHWSAWRSDANARLRRMNDYLRIDLCIAQRLAGLLLWVVGIPAGMRTRGGTTAEARHPGGSLLKSLAGGVTTSGPCHRLSGVAGAGAVV